MKVSILCYDSLRKFVRKTDKKVLSSIKKKSCQASLYIDCFQMKFLMGKRDAGNPLFLKLACEELRVFGKFEMVCMHFTLALCRIS